MVSLIHTGARAIYNSYPGYEGFIAVQNVSCTGEEPSPLLCETSTEIQPVCRRPGALAGVQCLGESQ